MKFSANTIDLLKTQEEFAKKYDPCRISRHRFGLPIVMMAHSTIGRHGVPIKELLGIRKCLLYLTGQVSWRYYLWFVPLPFKQVPFTRGPFGGYWESKKLSLLVDSLILTVLAYQQSLWEFETNLAQILINDIVNSFEQVCDWINRGVSISAESNKLIVPIKEDMIDSRLSIIRPNDTVA